MSSKCSSSTSSSVRDSIPSDIRRIVVDVLKPQGVKLLAVDFDMTLIEKHTQSKYSGSVLALSKKTRFPVKVLVKECLANGIKVGVVTFSSQKDVVQGVVDAAFGPTAASKLRLKCHDDTWWLPPLTQLPPAWKFTSHALKLEHILSLVHDVYVECKQALRPENVLLLDDDLASVRLARKEGVKAVQLRAKEQNWLASLMRDLKSAGAGSDESASATCVVA